MQHTPVRSHEVASRKVTFTFSPNLSLLFQMFGDEQNTNADKRGNPFLSVSYLSCTIVNSAEHHNFLYLVFYVCEKWEIFMKINILGKWYLKK